MVRIHQRPTAELESWDSGAQGIRGKRRRARILGGLVPRWADLELRFRYPSPALLAGSPYRRALFFRASANASSEDRMRWPGCFSSHRLAASGERKEMNEVAEVGDDVLSELHAIDSGNRHHHIRRFDGLDLVGTHSQPYGLSRDGTARAHLSGLLQDSRVERGYPRHTTCRGFFLPLRGGTSSPRWPDPNNREFSPACRRK